MNSRIAVITGAGSGIGRASAHALLIDGWTVVLAGRRVAPLEETRRMAGVDLERAPIHAIDVSEPSQVEDLFANVSRLFGRLDLLFNNAGSSAPPVALEELDVEHWRRVIGACLTGAFLCTRSAFALMKRQNPLGGRIINNGSISAHAPRPNSAPYTAAKHGITGLTKATALDGRPFNIACGQIDIGNAATAMTARMSAGVQQADGRIAPEPTMAVADVAAAVLMMARLPLDANVLSMTVMATGMPFVGRG